MRSKLLLLIGVYGSALVCGAQTPQTDLARNQLEIASSHSDNSPEAVQSPPRLKLNFDKQLPEESSVQIIGLPEPFLNELHSSDLTSAAWRTFFCLHLGSEHPPHTQTPPMLGDYIIEDESVYFKPRFPFEPGMRYVARFTLSGQSFGASLPEDMEVTEHFDLPQIKRKPAVVTEIYPGTAMLPENVLRFYIHFSVPMRRDNVYQHIKLLDETGQQIEDAFVQLPIGLWDPLGQRLTLFVHPGRIKRGVGPNTRLGSVLTAGQRYRLVIETSLMSSQGTPLAERFTKEFSVVEADRKSPVLTDCSISEPIAGKVHPLVLQFQESLDRALLSRMISIYDVDQDEIPGSIEISAHETRWAFTPHEPWAPGKYQIVANPALEDLAGNRLDGIFDKDSAQFSAQAGVSEYSLGFTAR